MVAGLLAVAAAPAGNLKTKGCENRESLMLFYILLGFLILVLIIMLIRTHLRNRALFRHLSGRVIFNGSENKSEDSKPDSK